MADEKLYGGMTAEKVLDLYEEVIHDGNAPAGLPPLKSASGRYDGHYLLGFSGAAQVEGCKDLPEQVYIGYRAAPGEQSYRGNWHHIDNLMSLLRKAEEIFS